MRFNIKDVRQRAARHTSGKVHMHELGITQNIVAIVSDRAGDRKVTRVLLEIGKLSAIEPNAIRFCFDACAEGTVLEGALLEIKEVEGVGHCQTCDLRFTLQPTNGRCACGSDEVVCEVGMELNIKEMEVD